MAARPEVALTYALIRKYTVASGQTVSEGRVVKFGTTDGTVQHAAAGEDGVGVCLTPGSSAAGAAVDVLIANGSGICRAKVGTGGATKGRYGVVVSDGLTDATIGGGSTANYIAGWFTETGVAGDFVGFVPQKFGSVKA